MPFGALRPSGRIREFKNCLSIACLIIMIPALTGCGLLPDTITSWLSSPAGTQQSPVSSTDSQIPPAGSPPALPAAPVAEPGSDPAAAEFASVPIPAASIETVRPFDPYPEGSLGSFGLNIDTYLDPELDEDKRIERLERTVLAMHRDLKKIAPPLQRLITVEKDIQSLVTQLQEFVQAEQLPPGQPPPAPTSFGTPPPPQGGYAQPPPQGGAPPIPITESVTAAQGSSGSYQAPTAQGSASVQALRIGEHADKTRIVLDVSGPATYRYDLDNAEKLLVIELPGTGWSGQQQGQPGKSPLIASWTVHPENGGSRVVVQLKKGTSVSYEAVLKPNGKSQYRIVLDLKK